MVFGGRSRVKSEAGAGLRRELVGRIEGGGADEIEHLAFHGVGGAYELAAGRFNPGLSGRRD